MDRGLVGYSLQGHTELDMTEATQQGMAEREREYSYQGVLGIRIVYALVQFIVCLKKMQRSLEYVKLLSHPIGYKSQKLITTYLTKAKDFLFENMWEALAYTSSQHRVK